MITLRSADGLTTKAEIRKFTYSGVFMGECFILTDISSPRQIDFAIGDYLVYRNERFELNYIPAKKKQATPGNIPSLGNYAEAFVYESIRFNFLGDELTRCEFLDVVLGGGGPYSSLPNFSFYASSVRDLSSRLQANLNRIYTGTKAWTVTVDSNVGYTSKNITIDKLNCWNALALANSEWGLNYIIRNRTITIGTAGIDVGAVFGYGKGNGLYDVHQATDNNAQIITRLRAYGSTKNVPSGYYNQFAGVPSGLYIPNLMLPAFPYSQTNPALVYLDSDNISAYGIREGSVYFDGTDDNEEIYPTIEGMTAEQLIAAGVACESTGALDQVVDAENPEDNGVILENTEIAGQFKVHIKDLGFDLSARNSSGEYVCAAVGETLQISMTSGSCASRTFDVTGIKKVLDKETEALLYYELTCNRYEDEDMGIAFPNSGSLISTGDTFVVLGIKLLEVYVQAAAQRLLTAATAFLSENDKTKFTYSPSIDNIYMARHPELGLTIKEGNTFRILDEDLGIDKSVVIQSLTIDEGIDLIPRYNVVLNDEISVSTIQKIINSVSDSNHTITEVRRESIENARRNTKALNQLRSYLLDADDEFDQELITAKRIAALLIESGTSAGNFILHTPVPTFLENYSGNANSFFAPACTLSHLEITIPVMIGEGEEAHLEDKSDWTITNSLTASSLTPATEYYLYAKCSKVSQLAEWVLTHDIIKSNQTDYFYFPCGTLLPVDNEVRVFKTGYGKTWINGRTVTTGRVQSISGENYMDLDTEQFKFGGVDVNVSEADTTTLNNVKIKGSLVVSPGGTEFPIGVYRGAYDPLTPYFKGDKVTHNGGSWIYINDVPGAGHTPEVGLYWAVDSAKGTDGTTTYTWIKYADDASGTGMSDNPTGKLYIGVAVNKTTPTESTNPADYVWSLIKGDPGSNAPYWEYRYAKNGSTTVPPSIAVADREPTGWTTTVPTVGTLEYLWITRTLVTADGVSLVQNWATPSRMTGIPGETGDQGPIGPSPVYQGVWVQDAGKTYYGTATRVDIVKYNSTYYVARTDAGTFTDTSANVPTNTAKWNAFGAQFESVATNLLFAQLAYIENLGVAHLRTGVSPNSRIAINRIVNESTGEGSNAIEVFEQGQTDSNTPVIKIDDTAGSEESGYGSTTYPGIEVRKNTVSKLSSIGIFANGSGHQFLPSSSGITAKATGVFLGNGNISGSSNYFAGAYADASNSGTSPTYAMIFGRNILVFGVVDGFMKVPTSRGLYDLPDNNATLSSSYSGDKKYFFWGGAKSANRVYNLPDPADYESGEIIWFANGNDHNSELKARSGDTINGYAYDARWVTLNGPTDFVEFMSNGSNMWRIVRSGGDDIVF